MSELEQHHVKYLERDGEDEIITVTPKEHRRIHKELKAQGVPPVSAAIIKAAHDRSPVGRVLDRRYQQSEKGKMTHERYVQSEKGKLVGAKKSKKYLQTEKGKAGHRAACARWRVKQKELLV